MKYQCTVYVNIKIHYTSLLYIPSEIKLRGIKNSINVEKILILRSLGIYPIFVISS